MNLESAKQACLEALKLFIADACNENKMELHIVYEDIEDAEKEKVLGEELNAALSRIIHDNDHPDDYLAELKARFF